MERFLYISIGAIVGANARYLISIWAAERFGVNFPYGTFLVNVIGCFIIGFFFGLGETRITITPELRLLFAVGFLGAFTTFSTFGFESVSLARSGALWFSILNIFGTNLIGLMAVIGGLAVARILA
ncbi:MAG: fluoride efflux transporter CrcB [Caldilinea sp.]|jgi:CrcB protein|uniref:fluoride efflux transporter CrcB n=1 Tax=Caldilinea sp. TaxID=2293560 RepID=UPI0030AEBC65